MRYKDFIERVREQADLGSFSEAETATRATVTVLGEYLTGEGEPTLVSRLPEELTEHLRREASGSVVSSSLDAFMQEVGKREGSNTDEASAHARAVVLVLKDAVGPDEVQDLRRRLPNDLAPLFD